MLRPPPSREDCDAADAPPAADTLLLESSSNVDELGAVASVRDERREPPQLCARGIASLCSEQSTARRLRRRSARQR